MAFELKRNRGKDRIKGQTLVEVTLILPLLIVLVGAALDWGLLFFVSHVVQDAVRQGARMAVTLTGTVDSPLSKTTIRNEVRRLIPDAGLFSGFRTDAAIDVDCLAGTPPFIRVRTSGDYSFYFMRILGLSTTTLTRETVMKYERTLDACPTFS